MSTDMYLRKHTHVKNYDSTPPEKWWNIAVFRGGWVAPDTVVNPKRVTYIVEEVGHWCNANAIHNWLASHIRDGERFDSECFVDRDELQQLLDAVKQVLASPQSADGTLIDLSIAKEVLPTDPDLFGSAEYDDAYWEDLDYTRRLLEDVFREIEQDKEENALYYYLVG